jgi:hypothetical protein
LKPLHDYFYRFPPEASRMPGRCRVRIYKRKNGTHTVLLTELNTSAGESIASACERIVTDLAASKGLNPKTTRWIQHDPPDDELPHAFEEMQFTWDNNTARDPKWQPVDDEQAEALTEESLSALNRRLGDVEPKIAVDPKLEDETAHAHNETQGAA